MSGEPEPVLAPTPEVITTRWFLLSTWRDSVAHIAERPAIVPWWVFRSLEVWVGEKRVARGKPWLALSTCWVFALLGTGAGKTAPSGTVIGEPPVCPTIVTSPSPRKNVIGPALPGATYQFSISIRNDCAPLSGGVSEKRWLHSATVASPTPPWSNSTQPQNPPSPKGGPQRCGLSQFPEKPICQMAVLP